MFNLRTLARGAAVAVAAFGISALPSVVSAQDNGGSGNPGTLTVVVNLTGDPGGDPAAISWVVTRNTTDGSNPTVLTGSGSETIDPIDSGAWNIAASASADYTIGAISCISTPPGNGPGQPDFTVTGNGSVTCTIPASYSAPTTTTVPGDTTTTEPGVTTTAPGAATTTIAPSATTTTPVDQDALPPAAGGTDSGSSGASTGTMPVTGPSGETTAIALTALGMLMLGAGALGVARRH